jgi:hypothetical protein
MKTRRNTVDIEKLKSSLENPDKSQQELDGRSTSEEELIERCNLLEKYGLKEMEEKDVDELLGTRNSNSLDNKDLENMERVLAKKIYHAINSIPSIKKAAVELLMENDYELYGIVNIIVEYEPQDFLERLIGTNNKNNVYAETVEVAQIEISEFFESCPEIVENIEINVEFF